MASGTETLFTAASFDGTDFEVTRTGKLDGLSTPSYDVSESVLAGVRGTRFNQALMRKRQVTLEFLMFVDSEEDYFDKRQEIINACTKDDGEGELMLTIHGTTYTLNCVPEPPEISWPHFPYCTVQLQFIAYDPVIYASTEESVSGIETPSSGGLTFNLKFNLTFLSSGASSVTINNAGNLNVYPTLVMAGDLTNPVISNETTGEFFSLTYSLETAGTINADMKNRTVLRGSGLNLAQYVDDGAKWIFLQPGQNEISLSTDDPADTGTLEIRWVTAFTGI